MTVTLISHTPQPEQIIAAAAKLCYSDTTVEDLMDGLSAEQAEKFVGMLETMGHESPVEHVTFTFGIAGVSRSLLAQITRHRIASFSVQSQRYVRKNQFTYVTPPAIAADEAAGCSVSSDDGTDCAGLQCIGRPLTGNLLSAVFSGGLHRKGSSFQGRKEGD